MVCPRCGRENPDENEFCGRCGIEIRSVAAPIPVPDEEKLFCYRHPRTETQLRCGRCERPICTQCVVIGPAGPRCKECAKQNIAFRPGAVVYSAKSSVRNILRLGPWGIYILIILGMTLFGVIRSCASTSQPPTPSYDRDYERSQ